MSQAVSAQHPAVVLRSSYLHLRTLFAIAAVAIVCLTSAVVVLPVLTASTTTAAVRHTIATAAIANSVRRCR